jgi:hypothetical protein
MDETKDETKDETTIPPRLAHVSLGADRGPATKPSVRSRTQHAKCTLVHGRAISSDLGPSMSMVVPSRLVPDLDSWTLFELLTWRS